LTAASNPLGGFRWSRRCCARSGAERIGQARVAGTLAAASFAGLLLTFSRGVVAGSPGWRPASCFWSPDIAAPPSTGGRPARWPQCSSPSASPSWRHSGRSCDPGWVCRWKAWRPLADERSGLEASAGHPGTPCGPVTASSWAPGSANGRHPTPIYQPVHRSAASHGGAASRRSFWAVRRLVLAAGGAGGSAGLRAAWLSGWPQAAGSVPPDVGVVRLLPGSPAGPDPADLALWAHRTATVPRAGWAWIARPPSADCFDRGGKPTPRDQMAWLEDDTYARVQLSRWEPADRGRLGTGQITSGG
jgi:hypothetical protein